MEDACFTSKYIRRVDASLAERYEELVRYRRDTVSRPWDASVEASAHAAGAFVSWDGYVTGGLDSTELDAQSRIYNTNIFEGIPAPTEPTDGPGAAIRVLKSLGVPLYDCTRRAPGFIVAGGIFTPPSREAPGERFGGAKEWETHPDDADCQQMRSDIMTLSRYKDVDLFPVVPYPAGPDEPEGYADLVTEGMIASLRRALQVRLKDSLRAERVSVETEPSESCVDFKVVSQGLNVWCEVSLQVICRRYASPEQCIAGFDLNVCAFAATADAIVCTCTAAFGLETGTVMITPYSASQNMEHRIFKYVRRLCDSGMYSYVRLWAPCVSTVPYGAEGTVRGAAVVCPALESTLGGATDRHWNYSDVTKCLSKTLEETAVDSSVPKSYRSTDFPVTALFWKMRHIKALMKKIGLTASPLMTAPGRHDVYKPSSRAASTLRVTTECTFGKRTTSMCQVNFNPSVHAAVTQLGWKILTGSLSGVPGSEAPENYAVMWALRLEETVPQQTELQRMLISTGAFGFEK